MCPSLLRQVLDARLARLGEEAQRLLALAAVVGQAVPLARRYGRRDDQWARIAGPLTGREGPAGGTARDNRRFVGAVLCRYRAGGIPWPGAL